MNLPGLDQLSLLSPELAQSAAQLGHAAWTNPGRTPRETTAAFLGADLALGLFDLPLTLHTTMARQLGITDDYLTDVITRLAPHVGYPQAAQALTAAVEPRGTAHSGELEAAGAATEREMAYAMATASKLLNAPNPCPVDAAVDDILAEYGLLRTITPNL